MAEQTNKTESKLVVMEELEVKRTELCYITAINQETRTFFAQFCKFSNKELLHFLLIIHQHCEKVIADRNSGNLSRGVPKRLHRGDVICARYTQDQSWYRATVLSKDNTRQVCSVLYADYGNLETVPFCNIVQVLPNELPEITRAPFGITCFLKGSDVLDEKTSDQLLDCLSGNYAMIKVLERQTNLQWKVDIPKHA